MKCVLLLYAVLIAFLPVGLNAQTVLRKGDTLVCQTDSLYILPPSVLQARLTQDRKTITDLKVLLSQKSSNTKSVIVWYDREVAVLREKLAAAETHATAADSLLSLCLTAQTKTGAQISERFEQVNAELFEIRVRFTQAEIERQKEQVAARKFARKRFWTGVGVGAGAAILGVVTLVLAL